MRRFSSIEPVGILNACTTNVRMKSARMTAITIDSKYSRIVDFLNVGSAIFCRVGADLGGPRAEQAPPLLFRGSHFQHRQERFLRDLDLADALHSLLAFLLLLEQLPLARDVAAVAFGEHVLAQRLHRLARDDAAPDRRL